MEFPMNSTRMTRRTTLAMLGLAPAGAVGAETFLEPLQKPHQIQAGSDASDPRIADALRRLADSIERKQTLTSHLRVDCVIEADKVVQHELTVRFVYVAEA